MNVLEYLTGHLARLVDSERDALRNNKEMVAVGVPPGLADWDALHNFLGLPVRTYDFLVDAPAIMVKGADGFVKVHTPGANSFDAKTYLPPNRQPKDTVYDSSGNLQTFVDPYGGTNVTRTSEGRGKSLPNLDEYYRAMTDAQTALRRDGIIDAPVIELPKQPRERLLDDAKAAITGDRDHQYGGPEDSFQTIAEFWTTWLRSKLQPGEYIRPTDVAGMMGLLKTARLASNPTHYDSWKDGAGYFACGAEVSEAA